MASSYTGLGTELMTTGENAGDWGSKTNTNLQIIEQLAGGYIEKSIAGGAQTTTLSVSDGSTGAEFAHRILKFTGTITGNQVVTIPLDVQQMYILVNGTSGAYTVQFKYASGSGSSLTFATTDKGTKIVYATADDGTNPNLVDTGISTNTISGVTGDITLDSPADIILDADGADISLKDGGTLFGTLTNSSGELVIKSSSSGTTAATFSGANVTLAGTVGSGNITSTGTVQGTTITATTAFVPDASDGAALGTSALEFSDLFLADGAVINFGDDQDITLTHSADAGLTTNGTFQATTITATTAFVPDASDGAALGTSALEFSDLFLADGAVINFGDDQDITLTHSADAGLTTNGTFQATTITATTAFVPDASDGAALGTTALEFSDLFLADGAVVNFGDDQDVTLTHVADAGLLLNAAMYLTFRDSALKISSSTDGQLDIDADTEVEITATTVDLNGILDVSGVIVAGGQISAADGTAGAPSISNTGDLNTGLYFSAADKLTFSAGGTAQVTFQDGAIVPVADDDIDLGTSSLQFKDVYIDGTLEADAITIGGSAVVSSPITALNNATQSELVTVGSTTTELDAEANLTFTGSALTCIGTITTGVDNTGHDVKFFGATSGSFFLWDESDDALELTDSSPLKIGDGGDMQIYHDGTNSYITNSQGALKIATETSGIALTIGHTTSETTIADNLTITGTTVGTTFDTNGTADAIILDANGNTTISSPTDDQIDFEIAGADDFTMTANTFTILSGSTIAIAAGGAITNAGTMAPDIVSSGKAAVFGF